MAIDPVSDLLISPAIASLPKADIHIHQEEIARFERVAAQQTGCLPYDPRPWIKQVLVDTAPGLGRITSVYEPDNSHDFHGLAAGDPEIMLAKMTDALFEGAQDGAIYMELRFGAESLAFNQPNFMAIFREAEKQVQALYPTFLAEAVCFVAISEDEERARKQFQACVQAAKDGLTGVDFRIDPYDREADPRIWDIAYRIAEQAVDAGLGITIHAGEFSPANIIAATRTPGVRRLGHAVYTLAEPRILDAVVKSGVTVECSLTCNVVLGAVASYEDHPILQFMDNSIPVTLTTDLPAHLHTTIGREYAIAAELGFTILDLMRMTRSAIEASFTTQARRDQLRGECQRWMLK